MSTRFHPPRSHPGSVKLLLNLAALVVATVTLTGCRMRNYAADQPVTVQNPRAAVQWVACVDRDGRVQRVPEWLHVEDERPRR